MRSGEQERWLPSFSLNSDSAAHCCDSRTSFFGWSRYLTAGSLVILRLVSAVVALWLIAPTLVVVPMSFTGRASFQFPPDTWSIRWYRNFFTNPDWTSSLVTSARVAALVTIISVCIGTAAAFGLSRSRLRGKTLLNGVILLPIVMPLIIVGVGVYIIFLSWGLVGTTLGFVAVHTALAVPFVVITVLASLRSFDRDLERAAAGLGASRFAIFFQVVLPLIRPGILSGALFAFVASFDEIVVALFISSSETRTLPVQMYTSVTREVDPTIAAASTLVITSTTLMLLLVAALQTRQRRA